MSTTLRSRIPLVPLFFLFACLLVLSSAHAQKPLYPTPTQSDIPGSIGALVGDFNGDGRADTLYLTSAPVSLGVYAKATVLLDQGTNPPLTVTSAPFPCPGSSVGNISLAAADLNNDNHLDLILACPNGYVAVLLGNGDGSFRSPAFYAVTGAQVLASPLDLNGDGFLDVAVTSTTSSGAASVVVLLNQGSANPGILLAPKSYVVATASMFFPAIGTGDFNGDGHQDLIVGNSTSKLAVLFGNGDGTLQPSQTASTGGIFATGDFNHDGMTDVACVVIDPQNIQPPLLQVLLGSRTGQFTTGPSLTLLPESNYSALFPAGTTHSGTAINLALVGDITSILLGDGKGGFTLGQSYGTSGTPLGSQTDITGITSLIYATDSSLYTIPGNGDGTFRAPLAYFLGSVGIASGLTPAFITADINGDGLTDILFVDSSGILKSALSRGDGTFSLAGEVAANKGEFLVANDFNRDGEIDVIATLPGNSNSHGQVLQDSEVFFYKGNGDGTFQPATPPLDLHVVGALQAVVGDFNGDSIPDLVLSYSNPDPTSQLYGSGLVFLFGKGDGTFNPPVILPQTLLIGQSELVTLDLNNDGKPDIIWNETVFYGNGDGTFRQLSLPSPGVPSALGDLNGDGIPDFASARVYAGNGDGTVHATPFYTATLPANSVVNFDIIADLNGDGHPDLLLQYHSNFDGLNYLSLSFGDGKGNFVLDNDNYLLGQQSSTVFPDFGSLARLNDHAPLPPSDNAPDFISSFAGSTGTVSAIAFLNQLNPPPSTLPAPPPPTLAPPDFTVSASPSSATIKDGQTATFTITITSSGGYAGTVKLSCGTLPSEATCNFSSSSLTPSNGTPATTTLTIATTASAIATDRTPGATLPLLAGATLLCFALAPPNRSRRLSRCGLLMLPLAAVLSTITGCGGTLSQPARDPGTPTGPQSISITLTDSAGTISHTLPLQITIQ